MKKLFLKLVIGLFLFSISLFAQAQQAISLKPIATSSNGSTTNANDTGLNSDSSYWRAANGNSNQQITFELTNPTERIYSVYFSFRVCPYSFEIHGSNDGITFTRICYIASTYCILGVKKQATVIISSPLAYKFVRFTGFSNSYTNTPTYTPEIYDVKFYAATPLVLGSFENDVTIKSNNKLNITTQSGYIHIGAQNTGFAHIYTDRPAFIFNAPIYSMNGQISSYSTNNLLLQTSGTTRIAVLNTNGFVGIGTANPTSMLTVKGKIEAEEIEVKNVAADFVFESNYKLKSLAEVEAFIKQNNHLPGVAPASETSQGIELSKFNTLLLQKVEELTLYTIELNKQVETLKAKISESKASE